MSFPEAIATPKPKHYPNLDWLRLCFALSVPFLHVWNLTGTPFQGLFAAVPAFLALSGFVVLQSYERSRSTGHFFWKRLLRVGPAFALSFVVVGILFGVAALLPTFQSWYTFGLAKSTGRNGVLWSLSCEELAYISLAIGYALGVYKRPILLWIGLAIAILVGFKFGMHANVTRQLHNLPASFLIGNLFYVHRDRIYVKPWIPLVVMIAMVAFLLLRPANEIVQFLHQCAMVASFIWFGVAGPQIRWRLPFDISYGTYIYHYPIRTWLFYHVTRERWPLMFWCYAITLPFALVSWVLIEKPALGFKDKLPWKRPSPSPAEVPTEELLLEDAVPAPVAPTA